MTTQIHQPHDKLFKQAMADRAVAKEFFAEHLPANLLKQLDLNTLKLEKDSFVDEVYKASEADVVYRVNLNQKPAYIYLLCENQTKIDRWMAFRLHRYLIRLLEAHHKQYPQDSFPLVYPLVIYSGNKAWDAPLEFLDLFGDQKEMMRELWLMPYQLIDVYRIEDEVLRKHLLSGLLQFVMKHRQARDFERFLQTLLPWVNKVEIETSSNFWKIVLHYVVDAMEAKDIELFLEKSKAYLSERLRGEVMTLAQQFELRGEKRGMQHGLQQGEKMLLLKQLKRRFQEIPAIYEKALETADADTLLIWGERLIEAKNLDEIFNPPVIVIKP